MELARILLIISVWFIGCSVFLIVSDEEDEEMFINIKTLLRMTGEQMTDPKRYFLKLGIRVFEDDDGEYHIMKNAAILYARSAIGRVEAIKNYKPSNEYEYRIQATLLGLMDEGFDALTEVKK